MILLPPELAAKPCMLYPHRSNLFVWWRISQIGLRKRISDAGGMKIPMVHGTAR
jgi:hypothetical protein